MIVNLGCKERGYTTIDQSRAILENYLNNVAPKYSGSFVEENKKFVSDFLAKRDMSKYLKIGVVTFYAGLTLLGVWSGDIAFANGIIDTRPLDKFFHEVYWTLFKVLMYIATPVWAWVGIILATSGANQEKRTLAKKVATGLVIGTGVVASAPWASTQLYKLWHFIFA